MKIWLLAIILAVSAVAEGQSAEDKKARDSLGGREASAPADPNEPEHWLDSSHEYATGQAQALTEWMDSFFGEPDYEVELPESLLRLDFTTKWDQEDGNNNNVRLRGKLRLPGLSERLNLVFSDDSGDDLNLDDRSNNGRNLDSGVGFLYEVSQTKRSRVDLTARAELGRPAPGCSLSLPGNAWGIQQLPPDPACAIRD